MAYDIDGVTHYTKDEVLDILGISSSRLEKLERIDRIDKSPFRLVNTDPGGVPLPGRPMNLYAAPEVDRARKYVELFNPNGTLRNPKKKSSELDESATKQEREKSAAKKEWEGINKRLIEIWAQSSEEREDHARKVDEFLASLREMYRLGKVTNTTDYAMYQMNYMHIDLGLAYEEPGSVISDSSGKLDNNDLWEDSDLVLCPPLVACRLGL